MTEPARVRMTSDEFIAWVMERPGVNAMNSSRARWLQWRRNGRRMP